MLTEERVKEELELLKAEVFFPNLQPTKEVQSFLEASGDLKYLRGLTALDLNEMAFALARYSAFLTFQENRLRSYINFCENNLKAIVGQQMENAVGFTFQEKDLYVRTHDEHAKSFQEKKDFAQTKLDYIAFMSNKYQVMIDTIKGLCFEKNRVARL